jgi:glycosyltransferase involved in cell wall biosynthesis
MRLAVDVTSLLDPPTGVTVVTRHLVAGLSGLDDLDVVGYAASWRGRDRLDDLETELGIAISRRPMAAQPLRQAWRRWDHPRIEWWTGAVDVVWGPNFVVPPTRRAGRLVTVHDLTVLRFPQMVTADVAQYPELLRRALDHGAHVHTVSAFVAGEVVELLGAVPERVHVVPNAVDTEAVTGGDPARGRRLAGGERYALSIATLEPRKDITALVRAFDSTAARDTDLRLVLAGNDGWDAAAVHGAIEAARHRDRIVRLGYIDDDTRRHLLAGALLLAYPSVYEGFGLPPLEAMAAGVPVLATAAGALPEVCGDAALLVPPGEVGTLATALERLASDEVLRADLIRRGEARVGRFSWARSVEGLRSVLAEVAHSGG